MLIINNLTLLLVPQMRDIPVEEHAAGVYLQRRYA